MNLLAEHKNIGSRGKVKPTKQGASWVLLYHCLLKFAICIFVQFFQTSFFRDIIQNIAAQFIFQSDLSLCHSVL